MRLINVETMELEEFFDNQIPPYAILSHRWEKDEVTFQDYANPKLRQKKAGFEKIARLCGLAKSMAIRYAWIDTCCIDKTSSAELSEAINSMFAWYKHSQICYAYLSDVPPDTSKSWSPYDWSLSHSAWFTRGWTLQELLAPRELTFYSKDWQMMGTREERASEVQNTTGIQQNYLLGTRNPVTEAPVAERFSWASRRQTTRTEDMAYCLLGLLDVNMPLLYGEGHKAFRRLQEEFMRTHLDLSLLTWGLMGPRQVHMGLTNHHSEGVGCLANTAAQFQMWNREAVSVTDPDEHHTTTNAGLLLSVKARAVSQEGSICFGFIPLVNIRHSSQDGTVLAIPLVWNKTGRGPTKARRADSNGPFWMPWDPTGRTTRRSTDSDASSMEGRTYLVSPPEIQVIPPSGLLQDPMRHQYYANYYTYHTGGPQRRQCPLNFDRLGEHGYCVADFYPPDAFQSFAHETQRREEGALLRFTHPARPDVFLLLRRSNFADIYGGPGLFLGTAPVSCTTWEHLLKPHYDRVGFERPWETFSWFCELSLSGLGFGSGVFIDVREGFDNHDSSSINTHIRLSATGVGGVVIPPRLNISRPAFSVLP